MTNVIIIVFAILGAATLCAALKIGEDEKICNYDYKGDNEK
jgi:hypothetical protein